VRLRGPQSVYALLARWRANFRPIDILVNNAGTILRKPAAEHPDEYWDETLEVNLSSQFIISRRSASACRARIGQDHLHRLAARVPGRITVPGYAASKGAIGQHHQGAGQ